MAKVPIPTDANSKPVQITPSVVALEETYDTTVSTTTEITLNTSTTFIEVTAVDEGIFMKWGTADVTNADFDEYIAKNTTRQYYIPVDSTTKILFTAVNFIERSTTALLVVIEK